MKIALINSLYGKTPFTERYREILDHNKIAYFDLDINAANLIEQVNEATHIIFRFTHYDSDMQLAHTLLPLIEHYLNKPVFPNQSTCWHFDDKVRQYYLFKAQGFPFIDTHIFWDREAALQWVEKEASFPLVFKLKGGAGSSNVVLLKNTVEAKDIVKKMFSYGIMPGKISGDTIQQQLSFKKKIRKRLKGIVIKDPMNLFWQPHKDYILFQKFLPGNQHDLRITVVGGRAFGFYRKVRDNDFRASGSGTLVYDKPVNMAAVKIALEISRTMGFQSMAYDFLFNENDEPEICEYSYTFQERAVYDTAGYWDEQLIFHKGHYWPQYFQLMDLLGLPDLKNI